MSDFQSLAEDCCRVFLGWRLREDRKALLAIGEGHLEIDLHSAEAWCDGEPLPPLFIAGELQREFEKALSVWEVDPATVDEARLEAEFASSGRRSEDPPALQITCQVTFRASGASFSASQFNRVSR